MEFPEYEVGQIVHIVNSPLDGKGGRPNCEAGWALGMSKYCGDEAAILYVSENGMCEIDIDNCEFYWSPDCFQESYGEYVDTSEQDAAEIDAAMESLFEGFAIPHS